MKARNAAAYPILLMAMALVFFLYLGQRIPAAWATTTTVFVTTTQTVTGYAIPSATTLGNSLVPFLLPIVIAGLLGGLMGILRIQGQINTFIIKVGLFAGCLLAMLSLTSVSSNVLPIALTINTGFFVVTYIWKGV